MKPPEEAPGVPGPAESTGKDEETGARPASHAGGEAGPSAGAKAETQGAEREKPPAPEQAAPATPSGEPSTRAEAPHFPGVARAGPPQEAAPTPPGAAHPQQVGHYLYYPGMHPATGYFKAPQYPVFPQPYPALPFCGPTALPLYVAPVSGYTAPFQTYPPYQQRQVPPYTPSSYYGEAYAPPQARKKGKALTVILITLLVLLIVGGGIAAALLLTGSGSSSYNLGSASVEGEDMEFTNMRLTRNGQNLVLTGQYDNNSKSKGKVSVEVEVLSAGSEQSIYFEVSVKADSDGDFTVKKAFSGKLSGAALGTLTFSASEDSGVDGGTDGYPWEDGTTYPTFPEDSTGTTPTVPTTPDIESTVPTMPTTPSEMEDFLRENIDTIRHSYPMP